MNADLEKAIELYRQGDVSIGRAAEIAGLGYYDFEALLVSRDIPKNWPEETVEDGRRGAHLIHDLRGQAAFGLWADRDDMQDSVAWVRKQRAAWSQRLGTCDLSPVTYP